MPKDKSSNSPDPSEIYGPGTWYCIHTLGQKFSQTQMQFILEVLLKNFPCSSCASHAMSYLKKHPINKSRRVKMEGWGDVTNANYLCTLHNDVNRRNGKYQMDIDTYLTIYRDGAITPFQFSMGGSDCPGCRNI